MHCVGVLKLLQISGVFEIFCVSPLQPISISGLVSYVCMHMCGLMYVGRDCSETSLIRHSMAPENNVGLGGYWIMECLLPYLCMVTVPYIMVGLERMLDYRGVGLERLWKMVLSILFSYTIPYMEKTLSTTECTYVAKAGGHIQRWELFQHLVHAISYVCLVKISS